MNGTDRYVVISADCHGGADLTTYRDYLEAAYLEEFDRWLVSYAEPYPDMLGEEGSRNWDSDRRLRDLEDDGIVAEVMYPNTVPPFFRRSSLASAQAAAASAHERQLRWAGLRAHNRWLADFCAAVPGRRAGIFQIVLYDIDAAVQEVRWAVKAGLRGGVLLPGAPPGLGFRRSITTTIMTSSGRRALSSACRSIATAAVPRPVQESVPRTTSSSCRK